MFLAIDPGANPGFAIVDHSGKLRDVGVVLPLNIGSFRFPITSAVIELPQARPNTPLPQQNDVIMLATRMGRMAERFHIPEEKMFYPVTWKGSIQKEKHHPRIFSDLDPTEQTILAERLRGISKKKIEDAMDAVGLAKWAFENGKF